MIFRAALFASWVGATNAFSPVSLYSHKIQNLDANTVVPFTTSLYATMANNTELLSPTFVPSSQASSTTVAAVPKMAQRWRKSTKQLATLGPASSSKEMIETLFLAGADVFRLNFSHGSQEQKKELLIIIRVSHAMHTIFVV
jgi:pyruvate kinase